MSSRGARAGEAITYETCEDLVSGKLVISMKPGIDSTSVGTHPRRSSLAPARTLRNPVSTPGRLATSAPAYHSHD